MNDHTHLENVIRYVLLQQGAAQEVFDGRTSEFAAMPIRQVERNCEKTE